MIIPCLGQQIANALALRQTLNNARGSSLSSCFAVTDLAVASIGAVGAATSDLLASVFNIESQTAEVDRRLASMWFAQSIYPIDWTLPPVWDSIAGVYHCKDGWIRLHTNLPHHRQAALNVIGCKDNKESVQYALEDWCKDELEIEIVEAGGVAAAMHSKADWEKHPQGQALKEAPLIAWQTISSKPKQWQGTVQRPLNGLKVLDMTRVLAGPVATRTLAGLGANVLRIDPPGWQEENVVPDIMLGKRSGFLNLRDRDALQQVSELLAQADVLVHGYRPGALDSLSLTQARREAINPGLIEVSLNAYGWHGPWSHRRGFDSLVQMSSGIAEAGMHWANKQHPVPLPVQALDHATGYLMAAAVIKALENSATKGVNCHAQLSLAGTAKLLTAFPQYECEILNPGLAPGDANDTTEATPWGQAFRLKSPLKMSHCELRWDRPASELGHFSLNW